MKQPRSSALSMSVPRRASNDPVLESFPARLLALQDRSSLVAEQAVSMDLRSREESVTSGAREAHYFGTAATPGHGAARTRRGGACCRRSYRNGATRLLCPTRTHTGRKPDGTAVDEMAFVSQLALSPFGDLADSSRVVGSLRA
jgi:hypothetical protein